jgi:hypothetical protein
MKPDEFIEMQIKENEDSVKRCVRDDETTTKLFEEMVKDKYMNGMNEDHGHYEAIYWKNCRRTGSKRISHSCL